MKNLWTSLAKDEFTNMIFIASNILKLSYYGKNQLIEKKVM